MRKNLFCMVLLMAVAMVSFVSCSNDDGGTPKLESPSIVQSEQTSENPITLARADASKCVRLQKF